MTTLKTAGNVFYDIVEQNNALVGFKNIKLKKTKT